MPGFHEAYGNMGNAFKKMAEWDKSMDCYEKALEIAPGSADVMYSYADALRSAGMEDSALDAFMDTVSLDMDYGHAYQQIVAILDSRCDWERCEPYRNRLKDLSLAAIARGRDCPDSPFNCLGRYPDESYARNVTRAWSLKIQDFVARLGCRFTFVNSKGTEPVITLGYLSNNVKNHPNAHLVSGLFKLHDRERFRVIIYSYGEDDGSFYRRKIEREADLFRDIRHVSYVDAARMIHEDGVDILIDLTGYTLGSVMEIPALRPAPVQVRYLGFPGSMQADFFDYIITDRIMTPPEDQVYYTEKFVYMPNCYQINDKNQPVSEMEYRRSDFGLPENAFVFCSFNTAYKIEPVMFGAWMDILKDVPESVLWLLRDNPHMERNLKSAAENHNVPGNRLVFSDKIPKDSHISRLKLADLALDTRLVSGHITTSDALFAGVPVITKRGDHFISRAPSSILTHMGFPELVTDSLAGYKDLAVRLAKERDTLEVIRERLKRNRETASLFDTARFVKNYEKGLTAMWDTWRTGRPPEMIVVAEDN
jgi:protein O-GlcNAc transferase